MGLLVSDLKKIQGLSCFFRSRIILPPMTTVKDHFTV